MARRLFPQKKMEENGKMKIIDLMAAKVASYEKREVNVLYQNDIFKTRLPDGYLCLIPSNQRAGGYHQKR